MPVDLGRNNDWQGKCSVPDGLVIKEGRRLLYGTPEEDIRGQLSYVALQETETEWEWFGQTWFDY